MLRFTVLCLAWTVCQAVFVDLGLPDHDLYKPGDLIIAGMFPRSKQAAGVMCGPKKSSISVKGSMAMRFALDRLTANSSILPNISLGYVIMDDCNREAVALMKATQLIPVKPCVIDGCKKRSLQNPHILTSGTNPQYDVVGVVGPFGSTLQLRTSLLMSYYQIPHISWIATSDTLSDKSRYEYFSRVVPPDRFQARALVDILRHYNWTYVSILYSEGTYGSFGIRFVRKSIKEYGMCIAYSSELRDDFEQADYDRVVVQLKKNYKAKVVALFVETRHGRGIMLALVRAKAEVEFVLLSSEGFGVYGVDELTHVRKNWLAIEIQGGEDPDFNAFYKMQSPFGKGDQIWSGEYDESKLDCSWDVDRNGNKSCHKYKTFYDVDGFEMTNWPGRIIDATNTYGLALHALITDTCPEAFKNKALLKTCVTGPLILKYIRKTRLSGFTMDVEFDEVGDLVGGSYIIASHSWDEINKGNLRFVGDWQIKTGNVEIEEEKMVWWEKISDGRFVRTSQIPESVCAKPCATGEFYLMGELTCCWECRRCRDNEYLRSDLKGCDICPLNTWPDQVNFTTCEPIDPSYMLWSDPIAIGLSALAGSMILVTILITRIFIKYRERKVIKGSSRELMTPIIIGLYLAFATVLSFIARAEDWLCYANYFGFNLSCTLIFGPLFLKTVRLYRIFAAAEKCEVRVRGVDSTTQIISMFIIFIVQVAIIVAMCFFQPTHAIQTMPVPTTKHVELSCLLPQVNLLSPLCYNILLLILCSTFGFLTRKLPDNFNESWYIFISVMTTLFVWIAFLPTYFMAFYAYHKSALLGLALILNGGVTVLCLFAPKLYALYFVDEKGIKVTNFDFSDASQATGTTVTA